jgi:hypothetical protein
VLLRGPKILATLKALVPPLDAETERELIAVAYAHRDKQTRAYARRLIDAHVAGATRIKSTLTPGFWHMYDHEASARLRRLDRADRGKLAVAMVAHGANGWGVAFEEDLAFGRELVHKLLVAKKRELVLTDWHPKKTCGSPSGHWSGA